MKKNLRYEQVTLLVPYREGGGMGNPGDWRWWDLIGSGEPVWVSSNETLSADEAREILTTNGFGDPGDLADQIMED